MHHDLKAHPDSFLPFAERISEVQLRKNDRNFQAGDTATFYEWNPARAFFTGRVTVAMTVKIVLSEHDGLTPGWCLVVLSVPRENITRFNAELAGKTTLQEYLNAS